MDWIRFLDENNIHYVTRGPNTKRGEVSVQCPMCGEDDPSEHLGINLTTGKWGCHRDASHRGKAPRMLIKAILGCSHRQAGMIMRQYSQSDPDSLDAALAVLEADQNETIKHDEDIKAMAKSRALGPQFKDFNKIKPRGITSRFFKYLQQRGYDNPQELIEYYDLRCCLTGRYQDRIIIPVKQGGELIGWTSRAIVDPKNAPRYLASNQEIKSTILNYDHIKDGGRRLFIVEGPFDALKIDFYLKDYYILAKDAGNTRATCTFGTSVTVPQIILLRALVKKFKETWVLFDKGADGPSQELATWLGVKSAYLPEGVKDPGELDTLELDFLGDTYFDGLIDKMRWYSGYRTQSRVLYRWGNNKP